MAGQGTKQRIVARKSLWFLVLLTTVCVGTGGFRAAQAVESVSFANGITAVLHIPAEIASRLDLTDKGSLVLTDPALGSVELAADADVRVPFTSVQVLAALEAMQGLATRVTVDVFILPCTPLATGSSFARRGAIVLAPGTGQVPPVTQANITTHEMGHVLTWAFMDSYPARWDAYLRLRGLDRVANGPSARHADRAREILAEDIRFLFGGPLATASGTIENHDLVTPDRIDGLQEMLAGFFASDGLRPMAVSSSAFPNPCNPLTTVEMVLPAGFIADGSSAQLRIYDLRGTVVRTVTGGFLANDRVSLQWDGSTDAGSVAASGRYLYVIRLGGLVARGAVTMVR